MNPHARLWHPWLRIQRVMRALIDGRKTEEGFREIEAEIREALAVRDKVRGAGPERPCWSDHVLLGRIKAKRENAAQQRGVRSMPEPTLSERISVQTMACMTMLVGKATTLNDIETSQKEGWSEAVRAMRYCLAVAMLRYADPSREPDDAWFERCGAIELGLNNAMQRLFKNELGVDLGESP